MIIHFFLGERFPNTLGNVGFSSILSVAPSVERPLFINCKSSNVRNGLALDRSIAVLRAHKFGTAFVLRVFELVFESEKNLRDRATHRSAPV
jgi:hypothetical protein